MPSIKERIKELRKEYGYTQESLAKALGLNAKSSIANYENGSNAPSDDIKIKMCEIFDCSIDYLMGQSEFRTKKDEYKHYKMLESKIESSKILEETVKEFLIAGLTQEQIIEIRDIVSLSGFENTEERKIKKAKLNKIYSTFPEEQRLIVKQIVENYIRKILIKNIEKKEKKLFNIPVLGKIAAGQPILAEEYLEGYLPVEPNIYGMTNQEEYFYLKVSGDSMNQKVQDGDYVLIHKQDYAEDGDVIVAIVNGDNEATLKRYKKLNEQFILLEPMSTNPIHENRTIDLKETNFQVIGKAIGKFGKF